MIDLSPINKAIAGGIVGVILTEAARYGFQPDAPTATALGVLVSAVVGYAVGHLAVYFAPKNSTKI